VRKQRKFEENTQHMNEDAVFVERRRQVNERRVRRVKHKHKETSYTEETVQSEGKPTSKRQAQASRETK
jgi:hypothetical protein